MTPDELKAALGRLGLSQIAFARLCCQSPITVNRWLADEKAKHRRSIPSWLPAWLSMYELLTTKQRATIWP